MFVQAIDIELSPLACAVGNNGSTFVVHVQHQCSRFFKAVAKKFLQYESDIRHQIDGVIPNEDDPRTIRVNRTIDVRFFDGCRSNFRIVHTSSVP